MAEAATHPAELKLDWMSQQGEWDIHAQPTKQGLTLADIQQGSYGDPPDVSDNMSGRPRGAGARSDAYRIGGYSVRTKHEIWLENASFLYEEALQRQWSSATDVPWDTIEPLPLSPTTVLGASCFFASCIRCSHSWGVRKLRNMYALGS